MRSCSAEWLGRVFCSKASARSRRTPSASGRRPWAGVPLHRTASSWAPCPVNAASRWRLSLPTCSASLVSSYVLHYLTGRTLSPFPSEPEHRPFPVSITPIVFLDLPALQSLANSGALTTIRPKLPSCRWGHVFSTANHAIRVRHFSPFSTRHLPAPAARGTKMPKAESSL